MKIAIPSLGKTLDSEICQAFGRCPYFIIVDSETEEFNAIENIAANEAGGAGIKSAQAVVDNGVQVVIAPRLGTNAANVLNAANLKLMKASSGTIKEIVKLYNEGALESLSNIHSGHYGK